MKFLILNVNGIVFMKNNQKINFKNKNKQERVNLVIQNLNENINC